MNFDAELKLRVRRILWIQGYHCPLEVDLSHFDYEETRQTLRRSPITDIDVLGIRFDPDLRMSTVVVDCKSGKESEPNRLFWLRGLMDFFEAREGYLVKSALHSHARALAPKLGIRVLDQNGLSVLEKALGRDSLAFDIGDPAWYAKSEKLWGLDIGPGKKPTPHELAVKDVYQYLQYLYWMVDDYRNIQTIMEKFGSIAKELGADDLRAKYLVHIGLQRFALSVLRMASEVAARDITDVALQSRTYLSGGALLRRERVQIFKLLNELLEQQRLGEKLTPEPDYFDELVEIVNRIIGGSTHASRVLQLLDAILIEHVFGTKRDLQNILGTVYTTDALVLAKRIALLFEKSSGLTSELFAEISTL